MEAHNRFLPEWFTRIKTRQITLPVFQRMIVWDNSRVSDLLTTILRGLPAGTALILEVGDKEKFVSRTMADAPESGERVTEQLLDGQQRLTSLWRSLNDFDATRTYLVKMEEDPVSNTSLPTVYGQARWKKNGNIYPIWVDNPTECWDRAYIPVRLLRPGDIDNEVNQWINAALPDNNSNDLEAFKALTKRRTELLSTITNLRAKIREFNLPYLSLPVQTPREVALDVFIKMNTSAVQLSTYDIIVALVEGETGLSLHDHVASLIDEVPGIRRYGDVPGLVLDCVSLRQDRIPSQAGYKGIDFSKMVAEWDQLKKDIKEAVNFLEEESVYDEQRLPSYTPVPVIVALMDYLPTNPDKLGNMRYILKKYVWRAFLTSRYEQSSASNSLQDYRGLRKCLTEKGPDSDVPIFNEELYPLPNAELIKQAPWPKNKTILGRGILALQMKCGAEDIADGARASIKTIATQDNPREYHHLFPDSKLNDTGLLNEQIFKALNCVLITWRTNRSISNKDPLDYLKERAQNSLLGEEELRRRLKTHLVPYDELASASYANDELRKDRIIADYNKFIEARAQLLEKAVKSVCNGRQVELSEVYDASNKSEAAMQVYHSPGLPASYK